MVKRLSLLCVMPALLASCSCNREKKEVPTEAPVAAVTVVKEIAQQADLDTQVLAIVKFYRTTCPACQMAAQPYEELAKKTSGIVFYAVDVDKDGDLKEAHPIRAIPTFIAFNKGTKVDTLVGFDEEKLGQLIDKLTGKAPEVPQAAQATEKTLVTEIVGAEQFKEKLSSGKKIAVKFYAPWCGFCKKMAPVFEKLAKEYPDVLFLALDVEKNKDLVQEYAPEGFPTFHVFDKGERVDTVIGARPDELERIIKELIAGKGKKADAANKN